MHLTLTVLVAILALGQASGQDLKAYLADLVENQTDAYPKGVSLYAAGKYAKAYKKLSKLKDSPFSFYEQFLSNSLVYQRNNTFIKKKLAQQPTLVPENYSFYTQFPDMKVTLAHSTTVALDKNLFKAILNDKDTIIIMLDTGGSGVGITKALVDKYHMKTDTALTVKGALPAFEVTFFKHPVIIPKIRIGDLVLEGIHAEYSEVDPHSKGTYTGPTFDVIMGLNTFIGYLGEVIFDWENKTLEFKKASDMTIGMPFLFYNSKPFTAFHINDQYFTALLDTGSPSDLLPKAVYLENYSKKEQKMYNQYTYTEYTLDVALKNQEALALKIGDYNDGLTLEIGGETIELLIGNGHQLLQFNLEDNLFILR